MGRHFWFHSQNSEYRSRSLGIAGVTLADTASRPLQCSSSKLKFGPKVSVSPLNLSEVKNEQGLHVSVSAS